jgi:lipopolysaccharide transport system permease protein
MNENNKDFDLIIESGKTEGLYWKDIYQYRELFYFMAWRDILVRYKQTILGVVWSLLKPVFSMVIFTVIFGKLAKFPSGSVPYPLLVFTAILPWQFFANSLGGCSNSLISNANLISKIYFPRLIIPTSAIIVSLVDFLISSFVFVLLMAWYKFIPGWQIVFLPLFLLLALVASLGIGLWLASLNVKYRDFQQIVPFIIQFGIYISPVGFSSNIVPEKWRLLYSLNPMVGVIDGFRWAILGDKIDLYVPGFIISILLILIIFIFGLFYFRKFERTFADVI